MQTIIIPLSKRKLFLMFIGALTFVVLGGLFLWQPDQFSSSFLRGKNTVMIVGAASVVFFGICAVLAVKKMFDPRPGIIISADGITDNSSGVSAGIISWDRIVGINTAQVHRQQFILIMIENPEQWLDAQPNSFKKRMMKINYRMYQTPVCINANGLEVNFDELHRLIREEFAQYGNVR